MIISPYTYKVVKVIKMYDADTITVLLDLGMKIYIEKHIRFYGINAPEIRGIERPEGLISREWLVDKIEKAISDNTDIYVVTHKDKTGKYGRLLGSIYIGDEEVSLNEQLVQKGLAVFKDY